MKAPRMIHDGPEAWGGLYWPAVVDMQLPGQAQVGRRHAPRLPSSTPGPRANKHPDYICTLVRFSVSAADRHPAVPLTRARLVLANLNPRRQCQPSPN